MTIEEFIKMGGSIHFSYCKKILNWYSECYLAKIEDDYFVVHGQAIGNERFHTFNEAYEYFAKNVLSEKNLAYVIGRLTKKGLWTENEMDMVELMSRKGNRATKEEKMSVYKLIAKEKRLIVKEKSLLKS